METFHLISYKNGKVSSTSVSILEILILTLAIVFAMMSLLLLLLLPDKPCIREIQYIHEKRTYKLVVEDISIVWLLINILYIVSRDDFGTTGWNLLNRFIVLEWFFYVLNEVQPCI